MPNHERGTTTVTCEAPRATNGQALREQFDLLRVGGCAISRGIHPLNSDTTTALMPRILLCNSSAGSPQQTTNPLRQGEGDRNDALHFFPCHFLHLVAKRSPCPTEERKRCEEKRCDGQNIKSGGSDPTFSAFSRPKSSWDRSRPRARLSRASWIAAQGCGKQFVMQACTTSRKREGGKDMALLKAPSKQPKTTTLQVRLEEEVRRNLDRYAEFIDATPSYVVSEALKLLFKRDDKFKRWAGRTPEQHQPAANQRRRPYKDRVTNMKPRSTQFDVRENTASSRQHAPRCAVRSFPAYSARSSPASQEDVPRLSASSPQESSIRSPNNAARTAAAGGDARQDNHLLTVREVADLLQVPRSWVYGRMRKRSLERLPAYRLGKYWRFRRGRSVGVGRITTARLPCCLTPRLHSKAT